MKYRYFGRKTIIGSFKEDLPVHLNNPANNVSNIDNNASNNDSPASIVFINT